jgi:hypothetical protein
MHARFHAPRRIRVQSWRTYEREPPSVGQRTDSVHESEQASILNI